MGLPSSLRPHRWGPLFGGGGGQWQWSFLDAVWAVFLLAVVIFLALVFTPLRGDPLLAAAGAVPRCAASEVDLLPCEDPRRSSRLSHEMNYYDAARARHRLNQGGAWESREGRGAVGGRMGARAGGAGRRRGGAAGGGDAMEGRGEARAQGRSRALAREGRRRRAEPRAGRGGAFGQSTPLERRKMGRRTRKRMGKRMSKGKVVFSHGQK